MKGIRQQPNGAWRVYGSVKGDKFFKRFPARYSLREVQVWRRAKVTQLETGVVVIPDDAEPGGFTTDAHDYLAIVGPVKDPKTGKKVGGMPSYEDRARDIRAWCEVFGHQQRETITPFQIRRALEAKLKQGRAPSTVNHFRTALLHFFTTMNGKSGANPVKDVPPSIEHSDGLIRAHDYGTIYRLLALMRPSKTRTRLRLIAWTGWPHAQIMRLTPNDIDFVRARVWVSRRKKGKGVAGRWLPIVLPQTKAALERFIADDCFGAFSQPSMRKSLLLASAHLQTHQRRLRNGAGVLPTAITPYHLRHTFGTLLALYIEDERALQELLLCSLKQVRRYTAAATDPRVRSALEKVIVPMQTGEAGRKLKAAVAGNFGNFQGDTGVKRGIVTLVKPEAKPLKKSRKTAG